VADRVIKLTSRMPSWPADYKSNTIQWVREGQNMVMVFTPEMIENVIDSGFVMTFEAVRI